MQQSIDGPLYIGMDTHALSEPALATALEVLAANGVEVMFDADDGYTPTPVISHQELTRLFGTPYYTRIDAPATPEQKARLEKDQQYLGAIVNDARRIVKDALESVDSSCPGE